MPPAVAGAGEEGENDGAHDGSRPDNYVVMGYSPDSSRG
jgi:hypothetical protein